MGMIGGGQGAFIGNVHRMAAALDGKIELVAGAFSGRAEVSAATGLALGLETSRVYADYREMLESEQRLPSDKRIDLVSIVTPNYLHFEAVKLALEHGFHVMCEKPVAFSYEEANALLQLQKQYGKIVALTHNYTGYPMIKEARALTRSGKLGKLRKIIAEYPQGWLSDRIEATGQKQAYWRTNPEMAGASGCVGDIGTHAENLIEYITGLRIQYLAADVSAMVEGRLLDDDANILIRMEQGVKGVIIASQIANGDENELRIRIYGEKGGIEWLQSEPNTLHYKSNSGPRQLLKPGGYAWLSTQTNKHSRLPGGHPEGYIESMANLYRNVALAIEAEKNGDSPDPDLDFPILEDGVRGMKFIEAVIRSGNKNAAWIAMDEEEFS